MLVLSEAELSQIRSELDSSDAKVRNRAIERLAARYPAVEPPAGLAALITPTIQDKNSSPPERSNAVKALGVWGGMDAVPILVEVLRDESVFFFTRKDALQMLGNFLDDRAAAAIAGALSDGRLRGDAAAALKQLGPLAERAVAEHLTSRDRGELLEAIQILKEIGTLESIPALEETARQEKSVASQVDDAIRQVRQRASNTSAAK